MNRTLEACRNWESRWFSPLRTSSNSTRTFRSARRCRRFPSTGNRTRCLQPACGSPPDRACECGPSRPCRSASVWTRQIAALTIADEDLIADGDNGRELLNLCRDRGMDTLIYLGVASNLGLLGRSCGVLNMKRHDLQPIVVGDMAEAFTANGIGPDGKPDRNFTPAKGSAIALQHIEQHIAPSVRSRQLIAAAGLDSHASDTRPHVVFVTAEREYESYKTLPAFAKRYLEKDFRCTFLNATGPEQTGGKDDVPGLEALDDADLLVLAARRRTFPVVQMDHLEKCIRAGMPLVVLRTSGAAFQLPQSPWDTWSGTVSTRRCWAAITRVTMRSRGRPAVTCG